MAASIHKENVIGRCSICGGEAAVLVVWHGTEPPKARCRTCGAVEADKELPVVQMRPSQESWRRAWLGGPFRS